MKSIKNEKGYVLLLTIVLFAVTLTMCAALVTLLLSEINNNDFMEQREIAAYVANSGLEHAVSILENEDAPQPPLSSFVVYEDNQITGEYRIIELDRSNIVTHARLIKEGQVIYEMTLKAYIDEDGVLRLS